MQPLVFALDHIVLKVGNIDATVAFYRDVMGMQAQKFTRTDGSTRWALTFGSQKINLHQAGAEFEPKAARPAPGSADLCFLSEIKLSDWIAHLRSNAIELVDGPVARTGATGPIVSIYLRDPDGNLLELSNRSKA